MPKGGIEKPRTKGVTHKTRGRTNRKAKAHRFFGGVEEESTSRSGDVGGLRFGKAYAVKEGCTKMLTRPRFPGDGEFFGYFQF